MTEDRPITALDRGRHRLLLVPPRERRPVQPVLYLLDGNAALARLDAGVLDGRPDLAVVGIGYPDVEAFAAEARSLDYTPTPPSGWNGGVRQALRRPHGGADDFLGLLPSLIQAAEAELGLATVRRTLWGHSYGGLFGLHALLENLKGFDHIHAGSPALWWGDFAVEEKLLALREIGGAVRSIRLDMGEQEVSSLGVPMYAPERLARVGQSLDRIAGLDCRVEIFSSASHAQSFDLSLSAAVRTA